MAGLSLGKVELRGIRFYSLLPAGERPYIAARRQELRPGDGHLHLETMPCERKPRSGCVGFGNSLIAVIRC